MSKRSLQYASRDIASININEQIGSGTYGDVSIGTDKGTNQRLAIKRVKMENEHHGFPITALREIKILKALRHPNIISLVEVFTSLQTEQTSGFAVGDVFMAFEYANYDLAAIITTSHLFKLTTNHIKSYAKQLLEGLFYMHKNKIIHRDLKPANLLITKDNKLKIADFGLSRTFTGANDKLTEVVATLWYRPPELFFGERCYGPEIDMWAVGCIIPEMYLRQAIFGGNPPTDAAQLERIFKLCGTPTGSALEKLQALQHWEARKLKNPTTGEDLVMPSRLRERCRAINDPNGINLTEQLLDMDKSTRITASTALNHDYFWNPERTPAPESLPVFNVNDFHEADAKKSMMARGNRGGGGEARGGGGGGGGGRGPPGRGTGQNKWVALGKGEGRGRHSHGQHAPGRGGRGPPGSHPAPPAAPVVAASQPGTTQQPQDQQHKMDGPLHAPRNPPISAAKPSQPLVVSLSQSLTTNPTAVTAPASIATTTTTTSATPNPPLLQARSNSQSNVLNPSVVSTAPPVSLHDIQPLRAARNPPHGATEKDSKP